MKTSRSISVMALLPVMSLLLLMSGALVYAVAGWWGLVPVAIIVLAASLGTGWMLSRRIEALAGSLAIERVWERESPFAVSRVTELRALDAAWTDAMHRMERVFNAQRDFTANAAHELRTPLAALRLAGESALRVLAESDASACDAIGSMLEEAERAGNLVDRLLLLARAESGRMPVEPRRARVANVIAPVVEWLTPLAEERGQRLVLEAQESDSAWGDENLLRMALENVVSNAIRYSPADSTILIRASQGSARGVVIEVLDEGPGIEIDEAQRVFERFERGRSSVQGGSGLGLPIARWAVEAFGGRLEYERRLGQGSVFRIWCPG